MKVLISKKNGNLIVPCANKQFIIGHSSLSHEEFEAKLAKGEGRWFEQNFLIGFDAGSFEIGLTRLSLPADNADGNLPVINIKAV